MHALSNLGYIVQEINVKVSRANYEHRTELKGNVQMYVSDAVSDLNRSCGNDR